MPTEELFVALLSVNVEVSSAGSKANVGQLQALFVLFDAPC